MSYTPLSPIATRLGLCNSLSLCHSGPAQSAPPGGGALRVKISRGARLEVQNGTQQDLNEIIDLVNFGGKKIVYMLKMGGFEMGPNKIWIKW